jgi:hypothetical protein
MKFAIVVALGIMVACIVFVMKATLQLIHRAPPAVRRVLPWCDQRVADRAEER